MHIYILINSYTYYIFTLLLNDIYNIFQSYFIKPFAIHKRGRDIGFLCFRLSLNAIFQINSNCFNENETVFHNIEILSMAILAKTYLNNYRTGRLIAKNAKNFVRS